MKTNLFKRFFSLKGPALNPSKGFTLIELLIVIAVIGVLAAGILVAIDPVEQLARGRDSGRKSTLGQLGRALQAYYTANSVYPTVAQITNSPTTNVLILSGEIKTIPNPPIMATATACTGGSNVNGICYKVDAAGPNIVVYSHMESKTERNKAPACGTVVNTWFVYSSISGRAGTVCQAAEPNATSTFIFF